MTDAILKEEIKKLLENVHIEEFISSEVKARIFDLSDQNIINAIVKTFLETKDIQDLVQDIIKKEVAKIIEIKLSNIIQNELTLRNIEFSNVVYDALLCSDHIKRVLENPITTFLNSNLDKITKEVVRQHVKNQEQ